MAKVSKSKPAGPANAAAEFPLLGYVDQLVDGLRKLTPAALKDFDEEAIHQARVATRRLKAAVHLQLDAFAEQADHVACGQKADRGPTDGEAASGGATDRSSDSPSVPPPTGAHVDPHEVRIAGKALRYTLEMAVVDGHPLPAD